MLPVLPARFRGVEGYAPARPDAQPPSRLPRVDGFEARVAAMKGS
jgi:hypothetical protein